MIKLRLPIVFLCVALCSIFSSSLFAQCTPNQVIEAVVNGTFENGYLTSATSGGFNSDLSFVGAFAPSPCHYSIANQFAVARAETPATLGGCTANARQTYAGPDYIGTPTYPKGFNDHTVGQSGNGFALIGDFEGYTGSKWDTDPSGLPAVWREQVTIQANQKYTFSAWFANYNRDANLLETGAGQGASYNTPDLNFIVVPMIGATPQWAQRVNLGTATPHDEMVWQQFSGQWTPSASYTSAMILIEVQAANATNTNDLAIDDISFINGCDNLTSLPSAYVPDLGADFSLCLTGTPTTLNSNVTASATNQFWWYSGTGTTQTTLINGTSTDYTYNITTPGTYRVCVQNAGFPTGCSSSSTVVVTNTMPAVSLANQNICTSASVTLTAQLASGATYSGTGLTYTWTKPAGAPAAPNSATYTTGVTGNYSVSVSSPVAGCGTVNSNTATVTTSLVTPSFVSGNCSGSPKTFTLSSTAGSGATYGWYDASTGGNLMGTGNPVTLSYSTPLPTTIYLENYNATTVGPTRALATSNDFGGGAPWNATAFTALQSFTLQSIYIGASSGTGTATITIANASAPGVPIGTATQVITAGQVGSWIQVPVNFSIVSGNSYIINMSGGTIRFMEQSAYSSTTYGGLVTRNPTPNLTSGTAIEWTVRSGASCMRSPFTIDCTLPVTYVSFDAERSGNVVNLDWVTGSEQDAKNFVIERSLDGQNYSVIGAVDAKNSPSGGTYHFTDVKPAKANVYYRLRQVDINGSINNSAVRYVQYSSASELSVLPNPANDVVKVILPLATANETAQAFVLLYNSLGQEIVHQTITTGQLSEGVTIDLSNVSRGSYILKVITTEGEWIEQLIKD